MQICKMSKYLPLWEYVSKRNDESFSLSFDEMEALLGFTVDHSFLIYKKEFSDYGAKVEKIFIKERRVLFGKA